MPRLHEGKVCEVCACLHFDREEQFFFWCVCVCVQSIKPEAFSSARMSLPVAARARSFTSEIGKGNGGLVRDWWVW